MTTLEVVGFGALNVDRLYKVDSLAGKDDESFIIAAEESSGGSAANTVVGLARLGIRTGFIGKVADDSEGERLLRDLKYENVDIKAIVTAKSGHSGIVLGFIDKSGERSLYVAPGVNDTLDFDEIDRHYPANTRLLHLTSFVADKPFRSQIRIMHTLPTNIAVSLDPGRLYAKKGLEQLRPLLRHTSIFLPNQTELKLLTGLEPEAASHQLLAEGVKIIGVKLGRKGCFITDGEETYTLKSIETHVVDTTGAGDAWNAGFLYGILKNKNLKMCGRIANFVASKCITHMGARNGLPNQAELDLPAC